MVWLAERYGFEATSAHRIFGEAGLRELVEILAGHSDIARLLVVEVGLGEPRVAKRSNGGWASSQLLETPSSYRFPV